MAMCDYVFDGDLWNDITPFENNNDYFQIKRKYLWHYQPCTVYITMGTIAAQFTSLTIVYSAACSGAEQREHQSSASLAFVRKIHRDRWIPRTNGQ